jgi:hypothetical protein
MPNLLLPLLNLLLLALFLALVSRSALAQEFPHFWKTDPIFYPHQPDHAVAIDLLLFSQWDQGGNPLVDEGFRYEAVSAELKLKTSDALTIRGAAVVAYLQNDPLMTLPSTITNAHVSAASTDFVTLDAFLATDFTSPDGKLIVSPGLFYHHQWAYIAAGLDIDVLWLVANGDASLRFAYAGRYAELRQVHWDGTPVNGDYRITHNFLFGWTQVLSADLVAQFFVQYARQVGLLNSTLQFVGIYDAAGHPVLLVDDSLPRLRDRWQVNVRGRYTTSPGTSLGLDLSGYYDDWDLLNVAAEPNFETPIFGGARVRLWYLVAYQHATKYFIPFPTTIQPYMTQNSNLGTFWLQGPGGLILIPLGKPQPKGARWLLRASVLGFYRSDHIFGIGGAGGWVVEW